VGLGTFDFQKKRALGNDSGGRDVLLFIGSGGFRRQGEMGVSL